MNEIKPKGFDNSDLPTSESITNKAKQYNMENIMSELPDSYGVENFAKLVRFGGGVFEGVREALADDGKVSLMEGATLALTLGPQAFGLISAIPQIPQELVFDKVSEADFAVISKELDAIPNLKGDTRDASRELLKLIFGLKDWYFKYYVDPKAPSV